MPTGTLLAVEPADVYTAVETLEWLVVVLSVLIVLQMLLKLYLLARVAELACRVDKVLRYTEMHASISDSQRERISSTLARSTEELKHEVEALPDKAADKTVERLKSLKPDESHYGT